MSLTEFRIRVVRNGFIFYQTELAIKGLEEPLFVALTPAQLSEAVEEWALKSLTQEAHGAE